MPNLYTRMHAASLTDTMGAILMLTGAMVQAGLSLAAIKLGAILLFLLITSPASTYALTSAALVVLYATFDKPRFGDPDAPVHQHVGP
ncbi:MAG: monovalent cation/H(+) antiporter subunit G [Xanthomonadales bacterium]|nr:monovalent cation/H(+) antiporter subunit G [Xanthomonadales bacterium]